MYHNEDLFPFSLLSSKRQWDVSPRQTSQRQQLRVGKCSPHPSDLKPQSIPDTVSEICAARHALPSSGLLGARPPSRPADRTPLASGSAAWPSVYRRESRTCDTRRSYSEQSSANTPRGSLAGLLCPSDFRQLGNRWSCHLLLRQNSVSGRPDRSTALFSLSCQVQPTHKDIFLGWAPRNEATSGRHRCSSWEPPGHWWPCSTRHWVDLFGYCLPGPRYHREPGYNLHLSSYYEKIDSKHSLSPDLGGSDLGMFQHTYSGHGEARGLPWVFVFRC